MCYVQCSVIYVCVCVCYVFVLCDEYVCYVCGGMEMCVVCVCLLLVWTRLREANKRKKTQNYGQSLRKQLSSKAGANHPVPQL